MKITDRFDNVKTAVAQAQSTLSKRSIARAPGRNTRRQIKAYQVVMSLNNLLAHVEDNPQLEYKIQQARGEASRAAGAVVAGDPTLASEQMRSCSLMVMDAESFYLRQDSATVEIQSCTTESSPEKHLPTVDLPDKPEIASAEAVTTGDQPDGDGLVACEVEPVHANEEGNQ